MDEGYPYVITTPIIAVFITSIIFDLLIFQEMGQDYHIRMGYYESWLFLPRHNDFLYMLLHSRKKEDWRRKSFRYRLVKKEDVRGKREDVAAAYPILRIFFVSSLSSAVFNVLHLVTKIFTSSSQSLWGKKEEGRGKKFCCRLRNLAHPKFPSILHYYLTSYTLILIS